MNAEVEVVVTGVGAVTCHGVGAGELWRAMTAAGTRLPDRSADPLALMDLPLINLVPDLDLPGLDLRSERATRFAALAASEALADAGLDAGALDAVRSAVVLGSCMGEPGVNERGRGGQRWEPPFRLASALADELGLFGTALDVANACAAGGYALGVAMDLVRAGEADVVIAGGSDACSRVALGCCNRLGAVDPERCRPFESDRAGTVFAGGAGVVVVESAAHARACGALDSGDGRVLSLGGVGWSCDGDHPTAPREDGEQIVRAMRRALGEPPYDVGCVVPHGTGTRLSATPLADIREVRRAIDPAVREEFVRRGGWQVVRNFHADFGVPWQEAFNTTDRDAVVEYCRTKGITAAWRSDGGLRTTAIRPVVHTHPGSGEEVWFNHATFWHVTSLAPEVQEGLREIFDDEDLPTNTYYGDGGRIPDETVAHLRAAYRSATTRFDRQRDDVLIVDNTLPAHGREPFTGPRKIAVAMAEVYDPAA
ncbi:TauD/TfdA family dioxygenase [Streptomyces canus]|uniref:beta-ketoacyl synthase N-terminal-like domain-containing protein n=1 Tax=Streptomyces canus TaxID=58343 RepID=UPI00324D1E0F